MMGVYKYEDHWVYIPTVGFVRELCASAIEPCKNISDQFQIRKRTDTFCWNLLSPRQWRQLYFNIMLYEIY